MKLCDKCGKPVPTRLTKNSTKIDDTRTLRVRVDDKQKIDAVLELCPGCYNGIIEGHVQGTELKREQIGRVLVEMGLKKLEAARPAASKK